MNVALEMDFYLLAFVPWLLLILNIQNVIWFWIWFSKAIHQSNSTFGCGVARMLCRLCGHKCLCKCSELVCLDIMTLNFIERKLKS